MIIISPFEGIDDSVIKTAEQAIVEVLKSTPIVYDKELKIPKEAYDAERNQYNVYYFLESMGKILKNKKDKIIGIVDVDLYTPGLNFIFGAANRIGGNLCIISITRLEDEFYGKISNDSIFKERVKKEVIHELGHLFGLTHCEDPHCVMHFSNSLLDTDVKSYNFCKKCLKKLEAKN